MRRIDKCLNDKLVEIYQHSVKVNELNCKLSDFLPEALRKHFTVGSFDKGCLVLITTDPVWASQLRYHLPELRDRLRKEAGIYQLGSIKISLSTNNYTPLSASRKKILPLSIKARETIIAGIDECHYEPLKTALEKFVSNACRTGNKLV